MKQKSLYNKDKWSEGPWKTEHDFAYWIDDTTLYPCVAKRLVLGTWTGWVGLNHRHTLYMVPISDSIWTQIDVHGGVEQVGHLETNVIDVLFNPPQIHWWCGFSCNKDGDLVPVDLSNDYLPTSSKVTYKDFEYVYREVTIFAQQLLIWNDTYPNT